MVDIRPASQDDVSMIAAINVRGWQAAFRDVIPQEFLDRMDPVESESFVDEMISEGDPYHVAVAEDDGKVVGYVLLGPPISENLEFHTLRAP